MRTGEEIDLDLADAAAAKLDVAGAEAIILSGLAALGLGDDRGCDRLGGALGEDAGLGRAGVGAIAYGMHVREAGFEGAWIDLHPAVFGKAAVTHHARDVMLRHAEEEIERNVSPIGKLGDTPLGVDRDDAFLGVEFDAALLER